MRVTMTILGSVLLFFLFTSLWGFYVSIRPPKIVSNLTPKDLKLEYGDITITTADGVKLAGWYIPNKQAEKTIVLLHGYPADKGDILPAIYFLGKKYNLLLFDFRYLGKSEGRYSTAGAKETQDLLAAIEFLKSKGIKEVGVWGFSMGGSVALMTSPKAPEIKAIVSESSYASLDLMTLELYQIPILKHPLAYLTSLWARLLLGINVKDIAPAHSAKALQIPTLIIHSKNDRTIPFKNALLIQEALTNNPKAEFWFKENLTHGELGSEYQNRVEDFFGKNL